jgi:hypothetical protein
MGSNGDDASERGFTIVDKRGREEEPEPESEAAASGRSERPDLPRVDFASFLISLGTSALYHLGQVADPETGAPAEPDLPVARQTIDTLEILEEKTQGNLSEEEAQLLRNLLTDLRMRFVAASGAPGSGSVSGS